MTIALSDFRPEISAALTHDMSPHGKICGLDCGSDVLSTYNAQVEMLIEDHNPGPDRHQGFKASRPPQ